MTNDYGNLELHKVLLSAMKDIDKICRENDMKYYLHAGTLLGAVNHKGFIPWDDDVDISMFRDDYDKFCKIIQQEYSDIYFMQTYKTDEKYTHNRAELKVLGTKMTYIHTEEIRNHPEIGIDIVPLDNVPNCRLLQKIQEMMVFVYDTALQIKLRRIIPHNPLIKMIGLLAKKDKIVLHEKMDRITQKYNKSITENIGLLSYTWRSPFNGMSGYDNEIKPRKWYENTTFIDFEDTKFMVISDYEQELTQRYGPDYTKPYPEEKRVTKHDVKFYTISDEVKKRAGI